MSTREMAYRLIDSMTEEQLRGLIMLLGQMNETPSAELAARLDDVDNNRNLSRGFSSVEELWEELNADD